MASMRVPPIFGSLPFRWRLHVKPDLAAVAYLLRPRGESGSPAAGCSQGDRPGFPASGRQVPPGRDRFPDQPGPAGALGSVSSGGLPLTGVLGEDLVLIVDVVLEPIGQEDRHLYGRMLSPVNSLLEIRDPDDEVLVFLPMDLETRIALALHPGFLVSEMLPGEGHEVVDHPGDLAIEITSAKRFDEFVHDFEEPDVLRIDFRNAGFVPTHPVDRHHGVPHESNSCRLLSARKAASHASKPIPCSRGRVGLMPVTDFLARIQGSPLQASSLWLALNIGRIT